MPIDDIIAYEQGELDDDQVIELFQQLVDSGLAWQLQGHYGRTAVALIETGLVRRPAPIDIEPAEDRSPATGQYWGLY